MSPAPAGHPTDMGDDTEAAVLRAVHDALLPDELPVVPGIHLDASYLLAGEPALAGGDWYDALVRPSGRLALVCGDVVGHGVAGAAEMSRLQAVLHARLMDDGPLEAAVAAADRYAAGQEGAYAATAVVAELDPERGELSYLTAGHPPPLTVAGDGTIEFLPMTGGGPLGTGTPRHARTSPLPEGQLLLLYTDGAFRRPGREPDQAVTDLQHIVSEAFLDPAHDPHESVRATERVCGTGLAMLARRCGRLDDIAMLAAQRVPVVPPLQVRATAEPSTPAQCRHALDDWLDELGADVVDTMALQHAVGEVVANSVVHAYHDLPAGALHEDAVRMDATLTPDGVVEIVVVDDGRWQPRSNSRNGRGLGMARGFVDDLELTTDESGTTVLLRHRVSRAPGLNSARSAAPAPPRRRFGARLRGGTLVLSGPVNLQSVEQLSFMVDRATCGRTLPLTIDLDGVSHLDSSAVRLLHELVADDPGVDLVTGDRSTVARVLHVVGLKHRPPTVGTPEQV